MYQMKPQSDIYSGSRGYGVYQTLLQQQKTVNTTIFISPIEIVSWKYHQYNINIQLLILHPRGLKVIFDSDTYLV